MLLQVVPWGMRALLVRIKDTYDNPRIFITENGYCDTGTLVDEDRIAYYRVHYYYLIRNRIIYTPSRKLCF